MVIRAIEDSLIIRRDIELREGKCPPEYDGTEPNLPVFDPTQQYGMWMSIKATDSCSRMLEMFKIRDEYIPQEYIKCVETIQKAHEIESLGPTIGWKYTPKIKDKVGL